MILTTTGFVSGQRVSSTIGLVRGNAVRARNLAFDITAWFRNLIGGRVPEYADLLSRARDEATEQMVAEAQKLGADAILEVRYTRAQVATAMAEILAYGTAVKLASE